MSNRLTKILSVLCGIAFGTYMVLFVATIIFASVRTDVSAELRDAQVRVGALETQYYEAIAVLNDTDVTSAGLVVPDDVEYVALDGTPTVTRAGSAGN